MNFTNFCYKWLKCSLRKVNGRHGHFIFAPQRCCFYRLIIFYIVFLLLGITPILSVLPYIRQTPTLLYYFNRTRQVQVFFSFFLVFGKLFLVLTKKQQRGFDIFPIFANYQFPQPVRPSALDRT